MTADWFLYDGGRTVGLRGEVDLANAPELNALLGTIEAGVLVINCYELDFIDSSCLDALVHAHERVTRAGGRLRLTAANPSVARVVRVCGLDEWLDI
jgi:anti-anti-sigma factor